MKINTRIILTLAVLTCIFLSWSNAFAWWFIIGTLETHGTGAFPCNYTQCSVTSALVKESTTDTITYQFKGYCSTAQEGCKGFDMFADTTWNMKTKTAIEEIAKDVGNGVKVGAVKTQSSCQDNPWINKSVSCALLSPEPSSMAKPFPKTSVLINDSQRQLLLQQQQSKFVMSAPQAPVIELPTSNTAFIVPARVSLKVKHDPNFGVSFEFKRAPLTAPSPVPPLHAPRTLTPANVKTFSGVTTADVIISEPGKWVVRAASIFPGGAQWSEWRHFTAGEISKQSNPGINRRVEPFKK